MRRISINCPDRSGWIETLEPRRHLSAAAAPTNLSVSKIADTSLVLAWRDNSTIELGYQVFRSGDSGITWKMIALTGANVTSLAAGGLGEGSRYVFRVRGELAGGNFTDFSPGIAAWTSPKMPLNLSGSSLSGSRVDLKWDDVSSHERAQRLERSTDG